MRDFGMRDRRRSREHGNRVATGLEHAHDCATKETVSASDESFHKSSLEACVVDVKNEEFSNHEGTKSTKFEIGFSWRKSSQNQEEISGTKAILLRVLR